MRPRAKLLLKNAVERYTYRRFNATYYEEPTNEFKKWSLKQNEPFKWKVSFPYKYTLNNLQQEFKEYISPVYWNYPMRNSDIEPFIRNGAGFPNSFADLGDGILDTPAGKSYPAFQEDKEGLTNLYYYGNAVQNAEWNYSQVYGFKMDDLRNDSVLRRILTSNYNGQFHTDNYKALTKYKICGDYSIGYRDNGGVQDYTRTGIVWHDGSPTDDFSSIKGFYDTSTTYNVFSYLSNSPVGNCNFSIEHPNLFSVRRTTGYSYEHYYPNDHSTFSPETPYFGFTYLNDGWKIGSDAWQVGNEIYTLNRKTQEQIEDRFNSIVGVNGGFRLQGGYYPGYPAKDVSVYNPLTWSRYRVPISEYDFILVITSPIGTGTHNWGGSSEINIFNSNYPINFRIGSWDYLDNQYEGKSFSFSGTTQKFYATTLDSCMCQSGYIENVIPLTWKDSAGIDIPLSKVYTGVASADYIYTIHTDGDFPYVFDKDGNWIDSNNPTGKHYIRYGNTIEIYDGELFQGYAEYVPEESIIDKTFRTFRYADISQAALTTSSGRVYVIERDSEDYTNIISQEDIGPRIGGRFGGIRKYNGYLDYIIHDTTGPDFNMSFEFAGPAISNHYRPVSENYEEINPQRGGAFKTTGSHYFFKDYAFDVQVQDIFDYSEVNYNDCSGSFNYIPNETAIAKYGTVLTNKYDMKIKAVPQESGYIYEQHWDLRYPIRGTYQNESYELLNEDTVYSKDELIGYFHYDGTLEDNWYERETLEPLGYYREMVSEPVSGFRPEGELVSIDNYFEKKYPEDGYAFNNYYYYLWSVDMDNIIELDHHYLGQSYQYRENLWGQKGFSIGTPIIQEVNFKIQKKLPDAIYRELRSGLPFIFYEEGYIADARNSIPSGLFLIDEIKGDDDWNYSVRGYSLLNKLLDMNVNDAEALRGRTYDIVGSVDYMKALFDIYFIIEEGCQYFMGIDCKIHNYTEMSKVFSKKNSLISLPNYPTRYEYANHILHPAWLDKQFNFNADAHFDYQYDDEEEVPKPLTLLELITYIGEFNQFYWFLNSDDFYNLELSIRGYVPKGGRNWDSIYQDMTVVTEIDPTQYVSYEPTTNRNSDVIFTYDNIYSGPFTEATYPDKYNSPYYLGDSSNNLDTYYFDYNNLTTLGDTEELDKYWLNSMNYRFFTGKNEMIEASFDRYPVEDWVYRLCNLWVKSSFDDKYRVRLENMWKQLTEIPFDYVGDLYAGSPKAEEYSSILKQRLRDCSNDYIGSDCPQELLRYFEETYGLNLDWIYSDEFEDFQIDWNGFNGFTALLIHKNFSNFDQAVKEGNLVLLPQPFGKELKYQIGSYLKIKHKYPELGEENWSAVNAFFVTSLERTESSITLKCEVNAEN